jgi:hypothetical protein
VGGDLFYYSLARILGLAEESKKKKEKFPVAPACAARGAGLCHILNPKRGNPYRASIHRSSSMSETGKVIMKSREPPPAEQKGPLCADFLWGGFALGRYFLFRGRRLLSLTGG